mgnify:CR=1 FL=1
MKKVIKLLALIKSHNQSKDYLIIKNGTLKTSSGSVSISLKVPINLDCNPNASQFIKAMSKCDETPIFTLTKSGKMQIKSGGFKANIDCVDTDNDDTNYPTGEFNIVDGTDLMNALKTLKPFVSTERIEGRIWTNGIFLDTNSFFATNNTILIERWTGFNLTKTCVLPLPAVNILLKNELAPEKLQIDETTITFHYENVGWIKCSLYSSPWPVGISKFLDEKGNQTKIIEDVFSAIEKINPSTDNFGRVYFNNGFVSTHPESHESGVSCDVEGLVANCVFNGSMFNLVKGIASTIDLSIYPKPSPFSGDNVRGVISGVTE